MAADPGSPSAAPADREVRVVRRALDKLRDLDIYQLAKDDCLAAEAALNSISRRLSRPGEYDLFDPDEEVMPDA